MCLAVWIRMQKTKSFNTVLKGAGFYILTRGIGNTIGCAEDWLRGGLVESALGVLVYRVFLKLLIDC